MSKYCSCNNRQSVKNSTMGEVYYVCSKRLGGCGKEIDDSKKKEGYFEDGGILSPRKGYNASDRYKSLSFDTDSSQTLTPDEIDDLFEQFRINGFIIREWCPDKYELFKEIGDVRFHYGKDFYTLKELESLLTRYKTLPPTN